MALIIEDGTGKTDATSYVTLAEIRAYATERGVTTIPAVDADAEVLAIKAVDYLEAVRDKYKGYKAGETQALQWPREDVYIDGYYFSSTDIPQELKDAQCQLCIEAVTEDLQPNGGGRTITKEKVDVIETEYAARGAVADYTTFTKVEALLEPILTSAGQALSAIRI